MAIGPAIEIGRVMTPPQVNNINGAVLREVLRKGLDDFRAKPSHAIFISVIYPVLGLILLRASAGRDLFPLLFPLIAGFSLVGPFAAIGLYALSRRHENGAELHWSDALEPFRGPRLWSLLALGLVLGVIFFAWLGAAATIYNHTLGTLAPESPAAFFHLLTTTPEGWALVFIGNGVGFLFALLTLSISAISFPMLIDRDVDMWTAVLTSVAAVTKNPWAMTRWGLIVAVLLVLGSLPFLVGLAVVFPVLGHATWHLYRALV